VSILYLLIPLAVVLLGAAVAFFVWSVRSGQFDDLEGPAHRILWDDDDPMIPGNRPEEAGEGDGPGDDGDASKRDVD
jgi:cbb3-type cytochrome oxidase maturation protein